MQQIRSQIKIQRIRIRNIKIFSPQFTLKRFVGSWWYANQSWGSFSPNFTISFIWQFMQLFHFLYWQFMQFSQILSHYFPFSVPISISALGECQEVDSEREDERMRQKKNHMNCHTRTWTAILGHELPYSKHQVSLLALCGF